ncbi:MAG: SMC-Scp complex subunit ScpB [Clostridia bacterium]|nr:SMC-Scp complex subunit ScpB [Clostridia bacterium]
MKLSNMIEALVFASGDPLPVKYIVEKLDVSLKAVNVAIDELKKKYGEESGIQLLVFNGKLQFASNPKFRDEISSVITPIIEKEFTKTILECAALIAYKQPVTRSELEDIRGSSCDYAIHTLLNLKMIEPCGRKDTIGKPILYSTTEEFLKRFQLNSIADLPDYDELMTQIAEMNNTFLSETEKSSYLYHKEDYDETKDDERKKERPKKTAEKKDGETDSDYPDFFSDDDIVITIE